MKYDLKNPICPKLTYNVNTNNNTTTTEIKKQDKN